MNLKLNNWTQEKYNEYIEYLYSLQDLKYKEFHQKITFDNTLIGIKTQKLKEIAKEIYKGNYSEYLKISTNKTYEEKMIYGFIISNNKEFDKNTIKYVNKYSKLINNWALCDLFCSNLKFVKRNKKEVYNYIISNINSNNIWMRRLCFVLLLDYYIEDDYIDNIFTLCDKYNTKEYYVQMAVAWLISICYIKYKDKTTLYLDNNNLDDFTYNKALQKIVDSKRISKEEKDIIRKKRRKNENRYSK